MKGEVIGHFDVNLVEATMSRLLSEQYGMKIVFTLKKKSETKAEEKGE